MHHHPKHQHQDSRRHDDHDSRGGRNLRGSLPGDLLAGSGRDD